MSKQEEFIKRLEECYAENVEISRRKSSDYATEDNPFKNFNVAEIFGIPVQKAILVRMADKMMRVSNLIDSDAKVKDESILDSLSDLANYATILRVYIEWKKSGKI